MPTNTRPVFYKPVFGNDNVYGADVVDIAAFAAPITRSDVALNAPAQKISEKI